MCTKWQNQWRQTVRNSTGFIALPISYPSGMRYPYNICFHTYGIENESVLEQENVSMSGTFMLPAMLTYFNKVREISYQIPIGSSNYSCYRDTTRSIDIISIGW